MLKTLNTSLSGIGAKEFTVLVAMLMSIVAITIDALLPALGIIGRDLHAATENHTQLLISLIFLGMAIGQLVCGPLSDAFGRKPVLFGGFALYLAGTLVCYFAPTFELLMVGRLIQGLGVAGPYISSVSLVRDMFKGAQMARLMSLVMVIFMLVPAIAPALGQGILMLWSWPAIFVLYFVYAVFVLLWISLRLKETLPKERRIPFSAKGFFDGFKEVVSNRITVGYTLCSGLFFGAFIGYLNSSRQIFQVQFDQGEMFIAYFGGLSLVLGFSSMVNSRIVEKYGTKIIAFYSILIIAILSLMFLGLHWVVDIRLWMFVMYASCLFFCFGLLFGNVNAMAMEPMGHVAGIASAVIGASSSILSMTIGTLIGQLYNNTLIPIAAGFFVLCLLALIIMFWVEKGRIHR